jgi:hypothetical protein
MYTLVWSAMGWIIGFRFSVRARTSLFVTTSESVMSLMQSHVQRISQQIKGNKSWRKRRLKICTCDSAAYLCSIIIWLGYNYRKCFVYVQLTYTIWSKVSGHPLETVIRLSLWHTSQSWTLILGGPTPCLYDGSNSAGGTFYQVSERLRRNGSPFFVQSCSQSS